MTRSENNKEKFMTRKIELMNLCFECFAEYGLSGTGLRELAEYCGCNHTIFYTYFRDLDELIVQSTEYCMSKIEDEFMAKAPRNAEDIWSYIDEIPYWTAENHGKKYRLMYQVYTHPKYLRYGKVFFSGIDRRYREYATLLEPKLGIPADQMTAMIYVLIRAAVHYALFGDEVYLKSQTELLKGTIKLYMKLFASKVEAGQTE